MEKQLTKEIKRSIGNDKALYLKELAGTGAWHNIRALRKPSSVQQGRLKDLSGQFVFSQDRAATLAEHLEKRQWAVRPVAVVFDKLPIADMLDMECGKITAKEVREAIRKLKSKKAGGIDGQLPEYFKALASTKEGLDLIVKLLDLCWQSESLPQSWKVSKVTMLFKKGDPLSCDNYRPIALLAIGYKLLASVLLARLKLAGAEDRIWNTQFGFKSQSGTLDALFLTRRLIDEAWMGKDSQIVFAALDWSKILYALYRFGVPEKTIRMI